MKDKIIEFWQHQLNNNFEITFFNNNYQLRVDNYIINSAFGLYSTILILDTPIIGEIYSFYIKGFTYKNKTPLEYINDRDVLPKRYHTAAINHLDHFILSKTGDIILDNHLLNIENGVIINCYPNEEISINRNQRK